MIDLSIALHKTWIQGEPIRGCCGQVFLEKDSVQSCLLREKISRMILEEYLPLLRVETSVIAVLLASICGLSTLTRFSSPLMLILTVMLLVPSGFGSATSGLACSRCLLLASCASVATSTWCLRRTGERRHQHGRRKDGRIGER